MENQTYEISAVKGFELYQTNEEFRKVLDFGKFIHCENRFVFAHPKYVAFDEKRIAHLTEYAKGHNEECCLIFNIVPNAEETISKN